MVLNFLEKLAQKIRRFSSTRGYACDYCGVENFNYPKQRLCDACRRTLVYNDGFRCQKCGRKAVDNGVCLDCKAHMPAFQRGFSPLVYKGGSSALMNGLKNGKRHLAYVLGEVAATAFAEGYAQERESGKASEILQEYDMEQEEILIVPVPMTKEREKERGYNQAAELALVVEERLTELGFHAKADFELLIKRKDTVQQKHLGFRARAENVRGAYHVHKRTACREKTVLLIDDIMTTGATGDACAKALYGAGAKSVYFLVAASLEERK